MTVSLYNRQGCLLDARDVEGDNINAAIQDIILNCLLEEGDYIKVGSWDS
jgi:hypothetical protein